MYTLTQFRFRYVLHPFAAKYSHWMWLQLGCLHYKLAQTHGIRYETRWLVHLTYHQYKYQTTIHTQVTDLPQ
jgi:hypothetical protein